MESRPAPLRSRRICRFCLSETENLHYIYDRDLTRPFQVPLTLQIMSCVSIEVYAADGMPQVICNNCRWNLDRSYKFKQQCKKADEALRSYPMTGVLPRPFPPISIDPPDTGVKRMIDSRSISDQQSKKQRLDNGDQQQRKVVVQKQSQSDLYEEQDPQSDFDNDMSNDRDDSKLEPGEVRVHACDQCDRTFPLLQSLQLHVQQAHGRDRNFKCTECDRWFFSKYDLNKHLPTHNEEKPYSCQICQKQFTRANLLQRHEKIHRDEVRYACSQCDREFFTPEELEKHEESVHKSLKPYQCNICTKRFSYKQGLERHEILHNEDKSFICEYCKEAFRTSTKLARHLQTHAGHRPYVCKLCPRTFLLSHHLSRHMRTHSVEKNHQCEDCGKAFKRKESLDVHQLTHIKRTGMGLTCDVCQETCRNRADYVTHIKQHIEAGEKMGPDGLPADNKSKLEMMETDEEEEEEEEVYSDGDDDYQPPSYISKKYPKSKSTAAADSEEDVDSRVEKDQIVYVRGKDGNVIKKTIKTLMPVPKRDNITSPETRNKSLSVSPQLPMKQQQMKSDEPRSAGRLDETEAQVQKIVASVFKEHKIPLKNQKNSQEPNKDVMRQIPGSQTIIKEEKNDQVTGTPGTGNTVKVIKRIIVRKSVGATDSATSSFSELEPLATQPSQVTAQAAAPAAGPKVTKRVIVRRIIRQGDTTREVIMNPDGTLIDPAELAKLPQGNVVKRVVVKKPLDKAQNIAAMLQAADGKQILKISDREDIQKIIKTSLSNTSTTGTPKVIAVERLEQKQQPITNAVISKDDQDTKEKLEQLEKRVEQQRLKIEELQARKQQEYQDDEMIPERHDESEDEQQLPLKRVFVKRKQCIYDEEKEYNDDSAGKEIAKQILSTSDNDIVMKDSSLENVGNNLQDDITEETNAKVVVEKSTEQPPDVDEMSRELCSILDSTDNVVKMQENVLNNLTQLTSIEVETSEKNLVAAQIDEPMEHDTIVTENQSNDPDHAIKIVITHNDEEGVKLEFQETGQNQVNEEVVEHSQSELSNINAEVLSESASHIFDSSDNNEESKSQDNLEESVIELSTANETINLNETTDSRDSLEDKLQQLEG